MGLMKNIVITLYMFIVIGILPGYCQAAGYIPVIKAEGVINPVMAEFLIKGIDQAEQEKAAVLVIELDTPGGLDTSMRDIVKKISQSSVPVVVYVSPSGSRAASAGLFILLSAHIAAMSSGTNVGAAHPVAMGKDMDKTMAKKAENDSAAYIRSLAEKRGRNAEWSEKAVRESVSATEKEALELKVIDFVAKDIKELLQAINGKEVETTVGMKTVKTEGLQTKYQEMGVRHQILSLISNPNVAYILMMLGFYGIFFELTNPGGIFPGVIGAIFLILAFYSFQTLPVNYAGLLLIILAIILFILEVQVTSYGLLTIGGLISMTLGSIMLFDSPLPFFRLSMEVVLPVVIVTSLFFILIVSLAIKAHRRKPVTGGEGLIGLVGIAKKNFEKGEGMIIVHGELWNALSDAAIFQGDKVSVVNVDGLKLKVQKKED
jgi:membrane-bound serine protease (ClpP class)